MPVTGRLRPLVAVGGLSFAGSLPTITLQVLALVSLGIVDYGKFSLLYLGFAWMSSLVLSLICEPWAHARRQVSGAPISWSAFGSMGMCVALFGGVLGLITGWIVGEISLGLATGAAIGLATARLFYRYYWLSMGQRVRQSWADVASSVVLATAGVLLPLSTPAALLGAWALSNILPLAMNMPPGWHSPWKWWQGHRRRIVTLVADSSLMDATTIGVPLILAPVMGLAGFGVYRAVGNVALPVRLVMTSVRPLLGSLSLAASTSRTVVAGLVTTALLISAGVSGAILFAHGVEALEHSAIGSLEYHLVPVGLFVGANFLAMYLQMLMRVHNSAKQILINRVMQMIVSATGPLVGWAVGGIHGAIWGLALSQCLQATMLIVWIGNRRRSEALRS